MTLPRCEVYEAERVGVYHCVSRCVRRAYLCGVDDTLGVSYEHRRAWVRERLSFLLEVFSIELISYAVMANHLHTLIRNRPDVAREWSAEEVARRWRRLFALRWESGRPAEPNDEELAAITMNPSLVACYRERLSNISWFNRCLCEHIARRANREDECTGRFWEGRFKSQPVYDICGLIACSAYVDLNPIRAGSAATPEDSDYTSIQDRIRTLRQVKSRQNARIAKPALVSIEEASEGTLSVEEYLTLVDQTGRLIIEGKGKIPDELADILSRLKIKSERWLDTTTNYRCRFRRVVGPVTALVEAARRFGKQWFHGLAAARIAFA